MPYKTVDAALFLPYRGVKIYHIYWNDLVDNGPRPGYFTVYPFGGEGIGCVSIDRLAEALMIEDVDYNNWDDCERVLRLAIDSGVLTEKGISK